MRFKTALAILKFHGNVGGRGEEPQLDHREGVQEEGGIPKLSHNLTVQLLRKETSVDR